MGAFGIWLLLLRITGPPDSTRDGPSLPGAESRSPDKG